LIPSRRIFDEQAGVYDRWFDEHADVYQAQVRMLRRAIPGHGSGLEIGVGSGRFAVPLGIHYGIDPSRGLVRMARQRGIEVVLGEGGHLPYRAGSFDYVLMMTVICFLEDVPAVFREVYRVLRPGGMLIVGFIEEGGEIQRRYQHESTKGRFLRFAKFRTGGDVDRFFRDAGFVEVAVLKRTRGFCVMNGRKQNAGRRQPAAVWSSESHDM
jgi:ubiquinone/menaquinone biosynthesis C-methylase UbiE